MNVLLWLLLSLAQDPPKPEEKPPAKQDEPPKPPEPSPEAKAAQQELKRIEGRVPEFRNFSTQLEQIKNQFIAARMAGDNEKAGRLMAEYQAVAQKAEALKQELTKNLKDLAAKAAEDLKKKPDDMDLLDTRVNVLLMLGETDQAKPDAKRVVELAPTRNDAVLRYARLLYITNQYDEAVKVVETLLARDKDHVEAQLIRGICLFAVNRFEESAKALDELLKGAGKKTPEETETAKEYLKVSQEHAGFFKTEMELRDKEKKSDDLPRAKLTTSRGAIVVELFENEAPNTVANFIDLAEKKFFDGTKFHRVVSNFMIQGGDPNTKDADPTNDGHGGPGYTFADEMPEGKFRRHFRGTLSMAHAGPNTNGSQFFITHLPAHWLNGAHTVFGRVLDGQEVVDAIKPGDLLEKVEILRKRQHEYKPEIKQDAPGIVPPPPPPPPKEDEPKKEEPKKDEPPKEAPKKDEPKKDEPPPPEPPK
jgi:cyclophilin family peptidyl-prolyl cis-trans isomerase